MDTICSCQTRQQLLTANNYATLAIKQIAGNTHNQRKKILISNFWKMIDDQKKIIEQGGLQDGGD